jgi:hypothetical protein
MDIAIVLPAKHVEWNSRKKYCLQQVLTYKNDSKETNMFMI